METRTQRDLRAKWNREALRETLHEQPDPPAIIHGAGRRRTPEETAELIRQLEEKLKTGNF